MEKKWTQGGCYEKRKKKGFPTKHSWARNGENTVPGGGDKQIKTLT